MVEKSEKGMTAMGGKERFYDEGDGKIRVQGFAERIDLREKVCGLVGTIKNGFLEIV